MNIDKTHRLSHLPALPTGRQAAGRDKNRMDADKIKSEFIEEQVVLTINLCLSELKAIF